MFPFTSVFRVRKRLKLSKLLLYNKRSVQDLPTVALLSITPSAWRCLVSLFMFSKMVIIAAVTHPHVCLQLRCCSLLFRFELWSKQGFLIYSLKLSDLKSGHRPVLKGGHSQPWVEGGGWRSLWRRPSARVEMHWRDVMSAHSINS